MKKSTAPFFLAFIFLIILSIGCSLTPNLAMPASTPEPTVILTIPVPSLMPTNIPLDTPAVTSDSDRPSIANTLTVQFVGKTFDLKFQDTNQPTPLFEYYPSNETPSDWIELVDFQVYPVNPNGNKPVDFAQRAAAAFMQQYPDMKYSLITDKNSDAAVLDLFYPDSTRKESGKQFFEFDAFKFFSSADGSQTISFHYAKNIEFLDADSFLIEFKKTREEIVAELVNFPLFNP
jgi:hypothetical protein